MKFLENLRRIGNENNSFFFPSPPPHAQVKLRENSLQRRHWRKGSNKGQDEPAHSSSGNWSASSESGRTSIASETTAPPKSSTTTSNNSLNHHNNHHPPSVQSRRRYLNNSTSSSVSEGTLTPDINELQYHDLLDGETSSIYSCDTEGSIIINLESFFDLSNERIIKKNYFRFRLLHVFPHGFRFENVKRRRNRIIIFHVAITG